MFAYGSDGGSSGALMRSGNSLLEMRVQGVFVCFLLQSNLVSVSCMSCLGVVSCLIVLIVITYSVNLWLHLYPKCLLLYYSL